MADLSKPDSGPNYTKWMNEEWFKGWKVINNTNNEYIIRREVDRMLEVFYNEGLHYRKPLTFYLPLYE